MTDRRDTVTFLLTDIEGSTRAWEASPDAMRDALARHDGILNQTIAQHGGRVLTERGEGDSFFAVFRTATDASAAAISTQLALDAETWPTATPIRVRMAIHTGEAGDDVRGPDVNRCARLRAIAHGGQVLVSASSAVLIGTHLTDGTSLIDLGLCRLRDLTEPERVFQLAHPGLHTTFPELRSLDAYRHNLPIQLTSLVGRANDLAAVIDLVREHRLVTLIGAGGAGKTRLALQAGAESLEAFADGVWFVDLAPLTDPDHVVVSVAAGVGVTEVPGRPLQESLAEHLAARELLIVLDNCEHLVEACSRLVESLLRRAPGIRFLATSREALNIPGEVVWRVPSLELPTPDIQESADTIAHVGSVELFCVRARAHRPGFSLTDANAPAVAQICRRLDGVPLAIELAAARAKVLSLDEILVRLEDRFRLLTGGSRTALPRQQTLEATVGWSYDLLDDSERILFRRLAVFAGGFDLQACEQVCGGGSVREDAILDLLSQLVDKSLVIAEPIDDGTTRYRLLETLRQYGRHKSLVAAGDDGSTADAHLDYYGARAEWWYERRVSDGLAGLVWLEVELDNFRAALDWSRQQSDDRELRLAGALGWFWSLHTAHAREGVDRLSHALAGQTDRSALVARALTGLAMTVYWADAAAAAPLAERAIAIWRELDDPLDTGLALQALGYARFFGGDMAAALAPMEESVELMVRLDDRRLINQARIALGQVLIGLGEVDAVEPLATETLAVGRELGEPAAVHLSLHYLGDCSLYRADGVEAERRYVQSFQAALAYDNVAEAAIEFEGLAMALAAQGRNGKAFRVYGAAQAKMAELSYDAGGVEFWARLKDRYLGPARERIGDVAADGFEAEGRTMGWEAAIAFATNLGLDDPAAA